MASCDSNEIFLLVGMRHFFTLNFAGPNVFWKKKLIFSGTAQITLSLGKDKKCMKIVS